MWPRAATGLRGATNQLQFYITIRFDFAAGAEDIFHDGFFVGAGGEVHDHFLGHEVHDAVFHAFGLFGGVFHQGSAVRAVDFDIVCLFHLRVVFVSQCKVQAARSDIYTYCLVFSAAGEFFNICKLT